MSHKLCFWWQNNEQHCHTCTHHITSHHIHTWTNKQTYKWANKLANKQTNSPHPYILLLLHAVTKLNGSAHISQYNVAITNKDPRVIIRQHVLRHMRDIDMSEWVSMCCKSWTTYSVHESFETRLTNTTIKYLADTICALVVTNRFRRKWALSQASRQLKYIAHPKRFQFSFRGKSSKTIV